MALETKVTQLYVCPIFLVYEEVDTVSVSFDTKLYKMNKSQGLQEK